MSKAVKIPKFDWAKNSEELSQNFIGKDAKASESMLMHFEEWQAKESGELTPYSGMNHYEMIQHRAKNPGDKFALELQAMALGAKVGTPFSKFSSLENGAGRIIALPLLAAQVELAALRDDVKSRLLAGSIGTNALKIEKVVFDNGEAKTQLGRVAVGSPLPLIKLATSDKTVNMDASGARISAPIQVLDSLVFGVMDMATMEIARRKNVDDTNEIIRVLINGNGGSDAIASGQTVNTATSTAIVAQDIINLILKNPEYFGTNNGLVIGNTTEMAKYLKAWSDMTDFAGKWPVPNYITWDSGVLTPSTGASTDLILKINPSAAIFEFYQNPGLRVWETRDDSGNLTLSFLQANAFMKGQTNYTVALDVTHG